MTQQVLQATYDLFSGAGGQWPRMIDLQQELHRRSYRDADAARLVQRIPPTLLRPLRRADGSLTSNERLILTAEGVHQCTGSEEDIDNFVTAIRWLARRAERSGSDERSEHGVPFTIHQLAEAVSLSLDADLESVHRLLAILQAEGLVEKDGVTQHKPWARALRKLGYSALSWRRTVLAV